MKFKQQIIIAGAMWAGLLACMLVLRPSSLPVFALIVPFVLLFGALLSTWLLLAQGLAIYSTKQRSAATTMRLGATVSGCIVLLLILQSLGQLTPRDVVTVVALSIIGYLYALRAGKGVASR